MKRVNANKQFETIASEVLGGTVRPAGVAFVLQSLHFSLRRVRGPQRHLTGRELCESLRDLAIHEFGLMAKEVLVEWGIESTEMIGRIVFALVDAGLMSKTEEDTLADFERVFDFEESFSPAKVLQAAREIRPRIRKRPS